MNIILCGMRGCGKSYLGSRLAVKLNRCFIETDEVMKSEYYNFSKRQATCREIVLSEGENFFRQLECQVIQNLKNVQNSIIALGGGTLCDPENARMIRELGFVIYLKASTQLLIERLKNELAVPSYLDKNDPEGSFIALLNQRIPLYEGSSHVSVDVNTENVLDIIISYTSKEKS